MLNTGELQYLEFLTRFQREIQYGTGFDRDDRTGVGTYSIFGHQMRFNLEESFPLFTHKQVFMRGIFEELMWFLRGDTNIKTLLEKRVHIWTEWRYKAYIQKAFKEPISKGHACVFPTMQKFEQMLLDDPKFAEKWGDIGKGYGHQWRNFGYIQDEAHDVTYEGGEITIDYEHEGFDQISWLIDEIKTNPSSRRLIVSGWNPHDVGNVDLPPCHTLFQFFVSNGKLSCQLYQRSADMLLGVPFNIASYALLTHLIALECGLKVGEFIWTGGDCHVYKNQIQGLNEIVYHRDACTPPQIKINKRESIFDYEWEDIEIVGYNHMGKVEIPVAV